MVSLTAAMFLFVGPISASKGSAQSTKVSWSEEAWQYKVGSEEEHIPVTVTAYSATPQETDEDPYVTASGKRVQRGIVALSRDLEKELMVKFGDRLILVGIGIFIFEDRMHIWKTRQVDIYMQSRKAALQFGVQTSLLMVVRADLEG
jgi:3D (Asp-Asp-Asp) domain-containing protein